jgi:hypothetical protein
VAEAQSALDLSLVFARMELYLLFLPFDFFWATFLCAGGFFPRNAGPRADLFEAFTSYFHQTLWAWQKKESWPTVATS